ncbi:hypothetical protein STCU_03854 [Strigomonas culicis]|uniref:Uncharacterized protein n=1 Tax=Strigomonas culicis TaxID=28005 RepID=S9UPY4_9TRYP|nr:hypothetical protein STCU_03854 [Strigomonas culicis]|eukprot:EPY30849.1 hypothetical protein STCU_03854 [Strigomonas culicis]
MLDIKNKNKKKTFVTSTGGCVLRHVRLVVRVFLLVVAEVLQLLEVDALAQHRLYLRRRRELARADPRVGRRAAHVVLAVCDPRAAGLAHVHDLVDADEPVFRLIHLLEEAGVHHDALRPTVLMQIVQQRGPHGRRRRRVVLVESKVMTQRIVRRADIAVDAVADARHVRRLAEVAALPRPDVHVVRDVPHEPVGLLHRRRQHLADGGDVLVVPRVAVGERRAVGDAGDLVAVVPPRKHARVLRRVLPHPDVRVHVVADEDRLSAHLCLEHQVGVAHVLGALEGVADVPRVEQKNKHHGEHDQVGAGDEAERLGIRQAPLLVRCCCCCCCCCGLAGELPVGLLVHVTRRGRPEERVHRPLHEAAQHKAAQHARHRRGEEHEARHLRCEEEGGGREEHHEEPRGQLVAAQGRRGDHRADQPPDARNAEELPVHVVPHGLVLRDGVDEGVAGAGVRHEERPHARRERPEEASRREHRRGDKKCRDGDAQHVGAQPQRREAADGRLRAGAERLGHVQAPQQHQHDERGQLLQRLEGRQAHRRHARRDGGADHVEEGVGAQQRGAVGAAAPVHQRAHTGVECDHVDHKDEAAPGRDHIAIREPRQQPNGPRPLTAQRAHPQVEGQQHRCDRNTLVVKTAGHGTHEVRRHHGEEGCRDGGRRDALCRLIREQRQERGGRSRKPRRHQNAHVVEGDGVAGRVEAAVQRDGGELQPRVDGGADRPAQRVPAHLVEPVEEGRPAVLREVLRRAVVEPRVELVDEVAVLLHRRQPYRVGVVDAIKGQQQTEDEDAALEAADGGTRVTTHKVHRCVVEGGCRGGGGAILVVRSRRRRRLRLCHALPQRVAGLLHDEDGCCYRKRACRSARVCVKLLEKCVCVCVCLFRRF